MFFLKFYYHNFLLSPSLPALLHPASDLDLYIQFVCVYLCSKQQIITSLLPMFFS